MTRDSITRWTCNSCSAQAETSSTEQPEGWVGYGFTDPDVPAGEQTTLGHLCGVCAARVKGSLAFKANPMRTDR